MSNDSRAESDLRLPPALVKSMFRYAAHPSVPNPPTVDAEALLAALEGPYEEALDGATDDELDAELARLGFDPQDVTRNADAFRKRVHEQFMVGAESDQEGDGPAGSTEPARPWGKRSSRHRAEVAEDGEEGTSSAASPARRTVLAVTGSGQVAEASSLRGNLHRLAAATGLAGRIGLQLDLKYAEGLGQGAVGGRHLESRDSFDLVIVCVPADDSSEVPACLARWPLRRRGDRVPSRSSDPEDDPPARPRVVELLGIGGSGTALGRAASPDRAVKPIRFDLGAPDVQILLYEDEREFEQVCQRMLAQWLLDVRLELIYDRCDVSHPVAPSCTTLCLSVAGGSALGADCVELSEGSTHLWNRVGALIGSEDGVHGARFLDVAFFHFGGRDRHRRAVEAGLRLVREAARLRGGALPNDRVAFVRLAIHDLPEHLEESRTLPEGYGFLFALAETPEVESGFAATAPVLDGLPSELKESFRTGGRFCGVPFGICEVPSASSHAAKLALGTRDLDDLSRFLVELETAVSVTGAPKDRLLGAVDTAVGHFYTILESCCRRVEAERQEGGQVQPPTLDLAQEILALERRAWALVEQVSSRSISEGGDGSWRAPLYIAAARRASVVFELERAIGTAVGEEAEEVSTEAEAALDQDSEALEPPAGNMLKAIRRVVRGDVLDAYTGFIELATHFKVPVVRYLREAADVGCMEQVLRNRLWQVAELLVAEDASELESSDCLLLPTVLSGPLGDVRFHALCRFLYDDRRGSAWKPEDELRARGAVVSSQHEQKLWQGRLLTARDGTWRREAAERLHWEALWPLLTYPRTPLDSIAAIATRFAGVRFERYGQVCLDCVAPRLQRCLEPEYVADRTLAGVRACVEAFSRFQFAASAGSFERLRMVADLYMEQCAARGASVGRPLHHLLARDPGGFASPEERSEVLFGLPLVVQRHLASEGYYLDFFVCHPDYRIARETFPHVRPERVEQIVAHRGINGALFHDLLKAPGLFNRPGALETALRHPKCDPGFAARNLGRLGQNGLLRLIRDPFANPDVRSRVEGHLKVRGFPSPSPAGKRARAGNRR